MGGSSFTRLLGQIKTFNGPTNLAAKGIQGNAERVIVVTAQDAAVLEASATRVLTELGSTNGASIINGATQLIQELRTILLLL